MRVNINQIYINLIYSRVLWIAHSQDIWAYPILKVLDTTWRSVFLAAMCAYIGLVYLLGLWLSDQLWWGEWKILYFSSVYAEV